MKLIHSSQHFYKAVQHTVGRLLHIMQTYPALIESIARVTNIRSITRDDLVPHIVAANELDKTLRRQRYLDGWMLAKLAEALGVSVEELKRI